MEKYNLEQNIKNHPKNNQQFLHLFFNIIFDYYKYYVLKIIIYINLFNN